MTSLFYKIVEGFGEFRKGVGASSKRVRFHIDGAESGILTVGRLSAPIKDGVASLSLSALDDGVYTPKVYSGGRLISMEAVEKAGAAVGVCLKDPALLRSIALRTEAIEERLSSLEKRCDGFAEAIEEKPLFG